MYLICYFFDVYRITPTKGAITFFLDIDNIISTVWGTKNFF